MGGVIALQPTDCEGVDMAEQRASASRMTTKAHADIAAVEEAFVAQWSNYGHAPGGVFHDEDDLV
jgi:hypothetical protein